MAVSEGDADPTKDFAALVQKDIAAGTYKPNGTPDDTSPSGLSWGDIFDLNTFERGYWLTADPLPVTQENLNQARRVFEQRCSGCHGVTGLGDGPAASFLTPSPDDFSDKGMFTSPTDSDGERYYRILTGGKGTAMENFGTRLSVEDMWRLVLFLRTIPNGGFQQPVTTVDTYQAWQAPPEMLNYIKTHPIDAPGLGPETGGQKDPFMEAAKWVFAGMAPGDTMLVGGKLPMDLPTLAMLIKDKYTEEVQKDIQDAKGRNEPNLPPDSQLLDTSQVIWHAP
jgi:mono/diheme cytochrome c family protein